MKKKFELANMLFNQILLVLLITWSATMNAIEVKENSLCQIDQEEYPAVGFGTYLLQNEICEKSMTKAIELGYRIFDTATFYDNFEPIGKILNQYGRERFYLISKVWHDSLTQDRLNADLNLTLKKLHITYLDAYLIHWPNSQIPIEETLLAMEELRRKGLIRHIGLSNVTVNHMKRISEVGVPIAWVQVEMHPLFYDVELLEYCKKHKIVVQAWAPLGRGRLTNDEMLTEIGKKHGKTASQVAIKWILQHECIPLPCSSNLTHMRQNMDVNDFELTSSEMQMLNARAKSGERERITEDFNLGFTDEFDFSYEECWPKN